MEIEIKGFMPQTLIDWEGKIAAEIFLSRCNFNCPYCHSAILVNFPESLKSIPKKEVIDFLILKKNWIDGLVITGGEPMIYEALPEFLNEFKEKGIKIKLDTNGSNPSMLREILKNNMVSYVAMDIKAPLIQENYNKVSGINVDLKKIEESIEILLGSNIEYEFRTTVSRNWLSVCDIVEIAKKICGAFRYRIQKFKKVEGEMIDNNINVEKEYSDEELLDIEKCVKDYVVDVKIR